MKKFVLTIAALALNWSLVANSGHLDFIGAGHDKQVVVTASSASGPTAQSTIDGFSIKNTTQLKDASRFLAQATFGADFATIEMTAAMGYEAWLEEQFRLPYTTIVGEMIEQHGGPITRQMYNPWFRSAWITTHLTAPDLLRQRLGFNWSQIMVVNDVADFFEDNSQFLANYLDSLAIHAFGNFEDLLTHVTLSPAMGLFLSHYNNPKENPEKNIHPDENYAREIMQLFSIGLWELQPDGTRKLDEQGNSIPTYSNADIKEFAQVFTGLGNGMKWGTFGVAAGETKRDSTLMTLMTAMRMYEEFHDKTEKHLLNGLVLPAGQAGTKDVKETLAHLINHNNTAPFICKSLIRMLTTSNPSPEYVLAVASVFAPEAPNNFQEVIKAILLHPEARGKVTKAYTFGKLREPIVRLLNLLRAFPISPNARGDYPMDMFCYGSITGQAPLEAPSVFNFFLPDYAPRGSIGKKGLIAPEFHILNSTNAIGILNDAHFRIFDEAYLRDFCIEGVTKYEWDVTPQRADKNAFNINFAEELKLADKPEALIERLDILIANGLLEEDTKSIIEDAITQLKEPLERVKMALYLILLSPDYVILK